MSRKKAQARSAAPPVAAVPFDPAAVTPLGTMYLLGGLDSRDVSFAAKVHLQKMCLYLERGGHRTASVDLRDLIRAVFEAMDGEGGGR